MKRAEKGLTLIEIMITIAILSSVMVATLMAVLQGQRMLTLSREEALAIQAAECRVVELKAEGFNILNGRCVDQGSTTSDRYEGDFAVEAQIPRFPSGAFMLKPHVDENGVTLPVATESYTLEASGLMSVRVTIQWRGNAPEFPHDVTLVTKVAP